MTFNNRDSKSLMKKNKIKTIFLDVLKIFKNSFSNFGSNRPVQLAGTTAYFAIFSTAPIIIIIISVFGYITGNSTIREKLFEELELMVGSDSVVLLQNAIDNYKIIENSTLGTIIGVVIFIISATALFSELQNSINFIWRVKVKPNLKVSILNLIRTRVFSFAVILGMGVLLLISIILDASIGLLKEFITSRFSPDFIILAQTINLAFSIGIIMIMTAFIYRFLPDIHVNWSAAWFGAGLTSVLFAVSRLGIGIMLRNSDMGIIYGTAGSIIILLIWVYLVSIIFYFGVELTHQFSLYYGHDNTPRNYAGTFEIHSVE
jgi:membrane protein